MNDEPPQLDAIAANFAKAIIAALQGAPLQELVGSDGRWSACLPPQPHPTGVTGSEIMGRADAPPRVRFLVPPGRIIGVSSNQIAEVWSVGPERWSQATTPKAAPPRQGDSSATSRRPMRCATPSWRQSPWQARIRGLEQPRGRLLRVAGRQARACSRSRCRRCPLAHSSARGARGWSPGEIPRQTTIFRTCRGHRRATTAGSRTGRTQTGCALDPEGARARPRHGDAWQGARAQRA